MNRQIFIVATIAAASKAQYTYGGACATTTDDDCALVSGCNTCSWSWPSNIANGWDSSDAKCRCQDSGSSDSSSGSVNTTDFTFGGDCATVTNDDCALVSGCNTCQWSWPVGLENGWDSAEAKCRCAAADSGSADIDDEEDMQEYEYGDSCGNLDDQDCGLVAGCNMCSWSWPVNDPNKWSSTEAKCRCEASDNTDGSTNDSSSDPFLQFGGDCLTQTDDDCAQVPGCNRCKFSWWSNDPLLWDSSDAKCRCQTDDLIPTDYDREDLEFGASCDNLTDDLCADVDCIQCSWSWPLSDPLLWDGAEAMCRCEYKQGEEIPDDSYPAITVNVDGVDKELWIQWPREWSEATVEGENQLAFDYNNRMYLAEQQDVDKTNYFTPNMLGGSLEYDVDLSEVGCGCVTALYTILMPAVDYPEDEFAYCDANNVDGHWCPEFDIMEANKYSYRATGHTCDAPSADGVYDNCDREGQCHVDVLTDLGASYFVPGSTSGIDTNKEFHVKIDFHETNSQFSGYTVVMTQQPDRIVELSTGDCSYLHGMSEDIQKMAFAISSWSTDQGLDWLQHGMCTGVCATQDTYQTISNLSFRTGDYQPVDDTEYGYSNMQCDSNADANLCGEDCRFCMYSWPLSNLDDNNTCRCLPDQRAPQGYTFAEEQCDSNTMGTCDGQCDCHESYPSDDPLAWNSAEKMCRCAPEPETIELSYGGECANKYDMLCGADCHECRETWPVDDPKKWYSDEMLCRCKSEDIREIEFGDRCATLESGECGSHCRECNMSWEATDILKTQGSTAMCRCKRSW